MFAKIKDGVVQQFPYSVGELRRDNPNTSFPKNISDEVMADFGMFPVIQKPIPDFDDQTHFVEWGSIIFKEGGQWFILPTVRELSAAQIAERDASLAAGVRSERDMLLAQTDWTALCDVIINAEMLAYRQALRDITLQVGFPNNVTWPTKPE
jgi:hypothetical protein